MIIIYEVKTIWILQLHSNCLASLRQKTEKKKENNTNFSLNSYSIIHNILTCFKILKTNYKRYLLLSEPELNIFGERPE